MWRNALIATVAMLAPGVLLLFSQLDFLLPYKHVLARYYGTKAVLYLALAGINVYAFFFLLTRKLFLKDTGRKLAHMEKQLREGGVSSELGARLRREE